MISIRELRFPEDMPTLYPLIKQLNPDMEQHSFQERAAAMFAHGYRCVGAFKGDLCLGVSGFWVNYRFYCGKYIEIDNLVVDAQTRSDGIGKRLLDWIKEEGKRLDCKVNVLSTYVANKASHRFYFREGFHIIGLHFTRDL